MDHCSSSIFIIFLVCFNPAWQIQCPAGQLVSGLETCLGCPNNSYRNETIHEYRRCKPCTKLNNPDLQLAAPCNSTHDNVYRCVSGKFNFNGDEFHCQACQHCERQGQFEAEACKHDSDAICCPYKGMMLKERANNTACGNNSTHLDYCCLETPFSLTSSTTQRQTYQSTEVKFTTSLPISTGYDLTSTSASAGASSNIRNELSTGEVVAISITFLAWIVIFAIILLFIIKKCPKPKLTTEWS